MPSTSTGANWGRLLIAGGTDFATLGRKDKSGKTLGSPARPDLGAANIVREVANIKFKRIFTSHSSCHAVAITLDEQAYLIGRNEHYQLSHPLPPQYTTPHLTSDSMPSPTPMAPYPFPLLALDDKNVPPALKKQRIVSAAVGRGHTVLITKSGEAWTAGWNVVGQCGHSESTEHVSTFKRVKGDLVDEKVIQASCGTQHTLFLTESGEVYAVGSGEKGVLGNGSSGEHIAGSRVLFTVQSTPLLVEGALEGRKIVQITSGQQHNVALDEDGFCYSWGFGGLGRLGIGAQIDVFTPIQIPQFAGQNPLTRAKKITAGSTNTLFIDGQNMVYLCGKFKTSGDGSSGQPWMNPRTVYEIQGYQMSLISGGGVTLFAAAQGDKKEGDFAVAWGQNAQWRELALGEGSAKSATKPTRIDYLNDIELLDISAGQCTTYFIARPPSTEAAATPVEPPVPSFVSAAAPAGAPAPPPARKPSGVDLSGFGFAFMPSPAGSAAASPAAPAAPTPPPPAVKVEVKDAHPSRTKQEAWEGLERWPEVEHDEAAEKCRVCGTDEAGGSKGELLECEKCEEAYHVVCVGLSALPDGEWFCSTCAKPPFSFADDDDEASEGKKRKADEVDDEAVVGAKKQK